MDTPLGVLAFAAVVLTQVAAVVALHGGKERRQSHPLDATRQYPRAGAVWDSAG